MKATIMVPVEITLTDDFKADKSLKYLWEEIRDIGYSVSSSEGFTAKVAAHRIRLKDVRAALTVTVKHD